MLQTILSVITVSGAMAAAFYAYKTNATSVSNSVMSLQKERISLMEKRQEEQEETIRNMTLELTTIKGENGVLASIFQGRDPRNIAFMELVTSVANTAIPHMVRVEEGLHIIAEKVGAVLPK